MNSATEDVRLKDLLRLDVATLSGFGGVDSKDPDAFSSFDDERISVYNAGNEGGAASLSDDHTDADTDH
jgi:hypothetical protein